MIIRWNRGLNRIEVNDQEFRVTCDVRNELNGRRLLGDPSEVVRTMPEPGVPYMPRRFPLGAWTVRRPEPRKDLYKAPVYIPTDAYQDVAVWDLDANGGYRYPTGEHVSDYGYGLHYSESPTTLGCGRIGSRDEVMRLAAIITAALDRKESVVLEVVEA